MKRVPVLLLLLLFTLGVAGRLQAQEEVDTLEQLVVDIWPDYDRPAVLVLLTGRLPAATTLPVTVTIPVPQEATIHAVASVSGDNQMFETPYSLEEGQLQFTAPEQRFRVEYYAPYEADGLERSFTFDWQSDLTVTDLNVSIQRPLAATTMTTEPEADVIGAGNDGLQYHDFVVQPLEAGEPFSIEVGYTLSSAQLSAPATAATAAPAPAAETAPETTTGLTMNWPLFLGGSGLLVIVLALVWYVWGQRAPSARPPRKPAVRRPSAPAPSRRAARPTGQARFCHNCGAEAQPEDRFCRACGTVLKR